MSSSEGEFTLESGKSGKSLDSVMSKLDEPIESLEPSNAKLSIPQQQIYVCDVLGQIFQLCYRKTDPQDRVSVLLRAVRPILGCFPNVPAAQGVSDASLKTVVRDATGCDIPRLTLTDVSSINPLLDSSLRIQGNRAYAFTIEPVAELDQLDNLMALTRTRVEGLNAQIRKKGKIDFDFMDVEKAVDYIRELVLAHPKWVEVLKAAQSARPTRSSRGGNRSTPRSTPRTSRSTPRSTPRRRSQITSPLNAGSAGIFDYDEPDMKRLKSDSTMQTRKIVPTAIRRSFPTAIRSVPTANFPSTALPTANFPSTALPTAGPSGYPGSVVIPTAVLNDVYRVMFKLSQYMS
eukprot:625850_1